MYIYLCNIHVPNQMPWICLCPHAPGDTIRVSLTEDPEYEAKPCVALRGAFGGSVVVFSSMTVIFPIKSIYMGIDIPVNRCHMSIYGKNGVCVQFIYIYTYMYISAIQWWREGTLWILSIFLTKTGRPVGATKVSVISLWKKMCFIIPTPILRMFLHVKSVLVMIWIEHLPTCAPKMME